MAAILVHHLGFPDILLEKVSKVDGFCFNIEKVIDVQSRRGQIPPLLGLNRVNKTLKLVTAREGVFLKADTGFGKFSQDRRLN